jgi:DNA-binding response OmpR family regulator
MKVLIVEDGLEYSETFGRFLADGFAWDRAGSGPEALEKLGSERYDAVFCDMRFDRVPLERLLGDLAATADQFNGDPAAARRHLEDHQGNYVLAAIRDAGHAVPVLMSYDFGEEPRRWQRLAQRYGPVDYLPDNASPQDVADRLRGLTR